MRRKAITSIDTRQSGGRLNPPQQPATLWQNSFESAFGMRIAVQGGKSIVDEVKMKKSENVSMI